MVNLLLENTGTAKNTWWIYVVLIVLVIIMLVVPTFTNRRRMKEYNQMVDRLRVGDEVRTIGGVVGRVVKISKTQSGTTFILETGAKGTKTTMEFDINAVGTVLTSTYVEEPKKDEKTAKAETKVEGEAKAEETKAEETEEVKAEESTTETAEPEVKEEKPAKAKAKTTSAKKSTKKTTTKKTK